MLVPLGFGQRSIVTSLGRMVYYTAEKMPWIGLPNSIPENQPNLVFVHGFGGGSSAYEWSKVYPAFATEYRILAPDLIGWGRSEHPSRNYQVEDYITSLIEFIEKTCGSPTDVIASSLMGAIAIRAAIVRPDLFKSLILTIPSGLSDFGQDYGSSFFAKLVNTPILDRLLYSTGIATEGGIRSFLEERQFADSRRVYQEIVDAYLQSALEPNAEYAALSFVRGDLCFDLSLYITQLTTPTAIIWGEKSQFTSPEIGPQLEVPAVTIGLIRQYLRLLSEG
jgi:pimeloyl-ACP methyl ester carboxylesterase